MGRFLQLLAFFFLIRFVWRAVARMLGGPEMRTVNEGASSGEQKPVYRGHMVRDPVCGVYIPEKSALPDRRDNQVYYFCSETCREMFRNREVSVK